MSYHFTPRGMATIKKTDITHVGQAVEELESSDTSMDVKETAALEHPLASPQNNQHFGFF